MDEGPQLRFVTIPVSMGIAFGFIVGIIWTWNMTENKPQWIVGWIILGGLTFFALSGWFIKARENWLYYQSVGYDVPTTQFTERGTIISITIPELNRSHQIHGLELDDWKQLARGVNRSGKYTTRVLQDIFGAGQGNMIYNRVTEPLKAAGVLVDSRTGGVEVTDHIGKHFFIQLEKGDYEILRMATPPSPSEGVI